MMQFSVLMSLYSRENPEYLRQCLQSLVVQTRPADQIVLVYDGDVGEELEAVVAEFTQLPLHIVRLPENVGLGHALNAGLAQCDYDWVFRMDSDDVCVPERFAKQCELIQKNPEIKLFGGQIAEYDTELKQQTGLRQVPLNDADIRQFVQKRNPFNHMTIAYRKSIVEAVGAYQHHLYMEDYNLWLRILANGVQTANLPEVLVKARTGENMLARRRGIDYIRSEWQLFQLKHRLHLQKPLSAGYLFIIRSLTRLLPVSWLQHIYQSLRSK